MHAYPLSVTQDGLEQLPPLEESYLSMTVVRGDPKQSGRVDLEAGASGIYSGVWECTEGSFDVIYPFHEIATILSGHLIVTDSEGTRHDFRAGDSFLAVQGEQVNWDVVEDVRKSYFLWIDPANPVPPVRP